MSATTISKKLEAVRTWMVDQRSHLARKQLAPFDAQLATLTAAIGAVKDVEATLRTTLDFLTSDALTTSTVTGSLKN